MTAFCVMLPAEDQAHCPPPLEEACFSVTNFNPWNEAGQLQPFNGQADADPFHTAVMIEVTPALIWRLAAVPAPLLGRTIVLSSGAELYGGDTFGNEAYRAGVIWHSVYGRWVTPVDVLTPDELHYLDCGGHMK